MKGNEYTPTPNRFKIPPVHVSTQEVRHNPRWDKKMKHISKLKRRGLL